jgi:hypothetical protein
VVPLVKVITPGCPDGTSTDGIFVDRFESTGPEQTERAEPQEGILRIAADLAPHSLPVSEARNKRGFILETMESISDKGKNGSTNNTVIPRLSRAMIAA